MQGDTDQVTEFGDTLYQRHAAHLEQRYFGQYVLFNLENENFVVGPSHLEAIKAYRANTGQARLAPWNRISQPCLKKIVWSGKSIIIGTRLLRFSDLAISFYNNSFLISRLQTPEDE